MHYDIKTKQIENQVEEFTTKPHRQNKVKHKILENTGTAATARLYVVNQRFSSTKYQPVSVHSSAPRFTLIFVE